MRSYPASKPGEYRSSREVKWSIGPVLRARYAVSIAGIQMAISSSDVLLNRPLRAC